jgi:hypothetical protein
MSEFKPGDRVLNNAQAVRGTHWARTEAQWGTVVDTNAFTGLVTVVWDDETAERQVLPSSLAREGRLKAPLLPSTVGSRHGDKEFVKALPLKSTMYLDYLYGYQTPSEVRPRPIAVRLSKLWWGIRRFSPTTVWKALFCRLAPIELMSPAEKGRAFTAPLLPPVMPDLTEKDEK